MISEWKISHRSVFVFIGCILVGIYALLYTFALICSLPASSATTSSKSQQTSSSTIFNMNHAPVIRRHQKVAVNRDNTTHHICVDSTIHLPFQMEREGSFITDVHYQCRGPEYDEFADKLEQYVAQNPSSWPMWGHRHAPIPANKRVLIVGNSHTRQTYQALMCQYQTRIDQAKKLDQYSGYFHFQNNATLVTICNTPIVYSKNWLENIESVIGSPLSSFDAILVGTFNEYDPETASTFRTNMLAYSETHPDVDFKNIPAPTAEDVAFIFPGPVVMFGMFGRPNNDLAHSIAERMIGYWKEKSNRTNIKFISGRVHIDNIGMEAISRDRVNVGLCYAGKGHHRCVGPRGGHPDLLAWDFVEALYHLLD